MALLVTGAGLHIFQGFAFGWKPPTIALAIWGGVLAALAAMCGFNAVPTWAISATLLMPMMGGLGLTNQLGSSTNPKWVDYSIIVDDVFIVACAAWSIWGG